jgi:hypothetical protein
LPFEISLETWRGDSSITLRLTLRNSKSCWQYGLVWLKDRGLVGEPECLYAGFGIGAPP